VPSSDGGIVSSSAAISNTATAIVDDGDLDVDIDQRAEGRTAANTFIWSGTVDGDVTSSTSANANAAYAGNWYGDGRANVSQTATNDVTATSSVDVHDVQNVSTNSTAVANASEFETDDGKRSSNFVEQSTSGNVFAASAAYVGTAEGYVQNTAVAAGNSSDAYFANVDKGESGAVQTTSEYTTIVSSAEAFVTEAEEVITTSAAVGNQFNGSQVDSYVAFGSEGSEVFQGNGAEVTANADITVDSFTGFSSTSANGVGNAFHVSGLGGSTGTEVIQSNFGNVNSDVRVNTGDFSGGTGHVSASSIGNSFSSVVQDGRQSGGVVQTNFSNASASTSIRTGRAGTVAATSTAIGNTATFENRRGD